jgi:hypothetical protein
MAKMTARVRTIAVAALLGAALVSTSAGADEARAPTKANLEEAQRRFQRGKELYDENDYQSALVEFRRAYELSPNYRLLYNIAQVQYQLQDYSGAFRTFSKYLADGQGDISAQRREETQREMERLKARIASVSVTVNLPQAEILVDDVPMGKAPLSEPVLVSIGRRKISATLSGYAPATKFVEVAGMDSIKVDLELRETGAAGGTSGAGDKDAGSRGTAQKAAGFPWIPWVITGGVGVAAAVTGGLTLSASSDQNTKLSTFGTTRADLDSARSKTKNLALATDILLGATVAGATVSLILTLTRGSDKPENKALLPLPVRLGVGPGNVVITGSF